MKRQVLFTLGGVTGSVLLIGLYSRIDSPWCWFAWIVLVPWLATLDQARSLRAALGSALVMNLVYVLVHFGWFTHTIRIYTGCSSTAALLTLILAAPILEPQFFVFAATRQLARRLTGSDPRLQRWSSWYVALTGASAYVAAEWAFSKLFAVTFGQGLYGSRLMRQAADIAGCAGLTFVLLIVNDCLLAVLQALALPGPLRGRLRRAVAPAGVAALVPAALLGYGYLRCRQIDELAGRAPRLEVAAVQANISNYDRIARELGTYEGVRFILDAHYALSTETLRSADPDLIVWPETVYPTTFGSPKSPDGAAFDREIGRFVAASGRPFIFGSYDFEAGKQFNAAVFIAADPDGKIGFEMYRKALLFPFTERVPAWLDFPVVRRWFPWLGTWTPGRSPEPVTVELKDRRSLRVAPLICYDALDPDLALTAARGGAQLIVTLSNDSWFSAGIAARLHLQMAAFRSIESHLAQVRATNTGISADISATGDIGSMLTTGERGVLLARPVLAPAPRTLMVRWGNWLPRVASVLTLLLLVLPRRVRRPAARRAARRRGARG